MSPHCQREPSDLNLNRNLISAKENSFRAEAVFAAHGACVNTSCVPATVTTHNGTADTSAKSRVYAIRGLCSAVG